MKRNFFGLGTILMLVFLLIVLAGYSNNENNNTQEVQEPVAEVENQVNATTLDGEENDDVIQVGDYTLEYGTYVDKYGTAYTLNEDGTYSCQSTDQAKAGTGTFEIFYFESSMWEYDYPSGINEGWYIGMNPDSNKMDSEKPWLFNDRYDVEENNAFYNGQTDEEWKLQ